MASREGGRKSSSRARRSSVDNEEVPSIDMSGMTERQIRQARHTQRSSSIQKGSSSRSAMQREEVARGKRILEAAEEHQEEAVLEEAVEIIEDDTPAHVGRRHQPRRKREPTPSEYYLILERIKV